MSMNNQYHRCPISSSENQDHVRGRLEKQLDRYGEYNCHKRKGIIRGRGPFLTPRHASRPYPAAHFRLAKTTGFDLVVVRAGEKKRGDTRTCVAPKRHSAGSARANTRGHARRNYTSACKYNEPCVSLWFMPRPAWPVSRNRLSCSPRCRFATSTRIGPSN